MVSFCHMRMLPSLPRITAGLRTRGGVRTAVSPVSLRLRTTVSRPACFRPLPTTRETAGRSSWRAFSTTTPPIDGGSSETKPSEGVSQAEKSAYDVLQERGFIKENTEGVPNMLRKEAPVSFYVGFDPTADSLHVGSLVPLMAMSHLQKNGHKPIALVGGGTGMIGDPSGKEEARQMMTTDTIEKNKQGIRAQIEKFIDLNDDKGIMVDNADWLLGMKYIDFLREYGSLFSVNVMLTKASVKSRLDRGMSFLEFNYQLLQAYDYLELYRRYGCRLQIGGDDQWGNIVGGIDLVRRLEQKEVGALTFPLLTTASGAKMGKTASGAVWLDPARVSPYDYYQFWVNVDDRDVSRFLKLFTFLDMDAIAELDKLQGADLRQAKRVLALEATSIIHGREAAEEAMRGAQAAFEGAGDVLAMPTYESALPAKVVPLLAASGLCSSKADAKRSIAGGAVRINGEKISDPDFVVDESMLDDSKALVLQRGKKNKLRVVVKV
ncbi:hypothetical protein AAMO2058_001576000 [Amorphochlora amoebiformis]